MCGWAVFLSQDASILSLTSDATVLILAVEISHSELPQPHSRLMLPSRPSRNTYDR
jgi:hypothetical protein